MRFISITFLLTVTSVVSATGLAGRHHEGGDDHDEAASSSMVSMSSTSSSLSPSPTASSANAGASPSSGAAFYITQPGTLTGALAVVVALMA